MFGQFPKARPALPEEIARIYVRWYRENREGGSAAASAAQAVEAWLHRQVAADLRPGASGVSTLELGAGTLNQLGLRAALWPLRHRRALCRAVPRFPRARTRAARPCRHPRGVRRGTL